MGAPHPTARSVAASVIARVTHESAFAAAALDAELDRAVQLEARDRALATELTYGTLRLLPWLEGRISKYSKRGNINTLDKMVRAHLAVAAYQILVLTRVPAFAAVSEAVSLIRSLRGSQVGGFANAVLRKIASEPKPSEEELAKAALSSTEPTLRAAMIRSIGEEGARALVSWSHAPPPLGIRIEDAGTRDAWIAKFREARPDATFEAGKLSPHAVIAQGAGRVISLPGYEEGAWTPQEEGSQVIALALEAQPGDVVLDACAGRGNKTGLLARAVGSSGGAVDAADVHPKKLDRLKQELERIKVQPRQTFAVDWSLGVGDAKPGSYDRALIDAPCSGSGTLRRRPELLLKRAGSDLKELATLQRAILERVTALVRPGGRVVYAVCSVLKEEGEEVIADIQGLDLISTRRLLPHVDGTDGYFIASFVRRA